MVDTIVVDGLVMEGVRASVTMVLMQGFFFFFCNNGWSNYDSNLLPQRMLITYQLDP